MRSIAIIPARSGSKGLKDKNIKEFAGKPLLAHSIAAAAESGVFDEIMVSTDSEEYAEIAREWGANVPFLRSEATSADSASSWDVVKEVLLGYKKMDSYFEAFCLLQPTSPLRTAQDVRNACEKLQEVQTAVVSVCEADHSPVWYNQLPEDLSLNGFINKSGDRQRQAFGKFYRVNGAIYFVKIAEFYKDSYIYREGSFAYIMDRKHSIDIDTEYDFKLAEIIRGVL